MPRTSREGIVLEARLLRVFLAQGSFAESRLFPAADTKRRMLATDIDVLVSEYGTGFNLTRRHVECKAGKVPLLDRVLWATGVRRLLEAESSYLVLRDIDYEAARFAWDLDVQLMSMGQVAEWEKSLAIPIDRWPCRSEFRALEAARRRWLRRSKERDADGSWRLLREALAFIEIDSWLRFEYRLLNRLFRYLASLGTGFSEMGDDNDKVMCCRYCTSALLVRLAQYLLAVCLDVTPVPSADLKAYLTERLTFGDHEPRYVQSIVKGTVHWVKQVLDDKSVTLPADVDVARLFEPPPYAGELIELVGQLLVRSDEAVCLPIALEVSQFDDLEELKDFPRLRQTAAKGDGLAALVKGFVVRCTPVSRVLSDGVGAELRMAYGNSARPNQTSSQGRQERLKLGEDG